ncbi:Beta-carotene isomerase D27-like protein [Gracilaria domingensis]|nr:Beta-carotene isomerase D27-like protein [Gracilaria domingensis]
MIRVAAAEFPSSTTISQELKMTMGNWSRRPSRPGNWDASSTLLTAFCSFTSAVRPRFPRRPQSTSNSIRHCMPAPHTRASLSTRGPQTPAPDYSGIDANPLNKFFTNIFLSKLETELGAPSAKRGYAGVVDVVQQLAARHRTDPKALQEASQRVLMSLFPPWLPRAFSKMFSKPIPGFAAWINAVVTIGVTQWLMGPSKLAEDGVTVEIERCRYLEGL